MLVRVRLCGGELSASQLAQLADIATTYGDGALHLTSRANIQLRSIVSGPHNDSVAPDALAAILATGLVPSASHEQVRNIMVSPLTGVTGGNVDIRDTAQRFDDVLCSTPELASLSGKFLVAFDDGRGDLIGQSSDLLAVAVNDREVQLRIGSRWGPIVELPHAPETLLDWCLRFVAARGQHRTAPWHIDELERPLLDVSRPDPRLPNPLPPLPFGTIDSDSLGSIEHLPAPASGYRVEDVSALTARGDSFVVTPWRGIIALGRG